MTRDEADQLWHELGELLAHSSLTESQCHEVKRAVIKYTTAHAQAAVDAFKADEWKFLDGPEFDYKKLTAEQEDLYAYAFNAGSKQAWEQAKAEHKSALADTLGMLEALAKRYGFAQTFIAKWDYLEVHWAGANFLYSGEDGEPEISRAEAEALLGKGKEKKE